MIRQTSCSRALPTSIAVAGSVLLALSLTACGPQVPQAPPTAPAGPQQTQQPGDDEQHKPIPGLVDGVYYSEPSDIDRVWRLDVSDGGTTFVYSEFGCEITGDRKFQEFKDIRLSYGKLFLGYGNASEVMMLVTVDGDRVNLENNLNEYFNSDLQLKDAAEAKELDEEFCYTG